MQRAIKYGAAYVFMLAAWTFLNHFVLINTSAAQAVNRSTPLFFNLLAFVVLSLGIRKRQKELARPPGAVVAGTREPSRRFGVAEGMKTGVQLAATYGFLATVFFVALYFAFGPWILQRAGGEGAPDAMLLRTLIIASAGMWAGSIVLGALYSAIISVALRTLFSESSS